MGYNLRYAALIVCCVLAIVVAAAFFPAAGYGDTPDREAVESEYYADGSSEIDFGFDFAPGDGGTATGDTDAESNRENENDDESDEEADDESDDGSPAGSSGSSGDASVTPVVWLLLAGFVAAGLAVCWRLTGPRSGEVPDGELPEGILPAVEFRLRRIPQLTMVAAIGASRTVPALLAGVAHTARGAGSGVGAVARNVGRGFGAAVAAVPTALAASSRGVGSLFSLSLSDGVTSLFGGVRNRARRSRSTRDAARESTTGASAAPPEEPEFGPRTVEEAWEEMTAAIPVSRRAARTPGEYARAAIRAGLPSEPVARLTDAFREIRYGDLPPSPNRTRRARDAFEEIERTLEDDGGDDR